MKDSRKVLNPTSLFYKGKLFQVGDFITCKVGYLNCSGVGFESYSDSGTLTKINVYTDTVTNSLYLNHGFTYNSIGSLGFTFEINGDHDQYSFESDLIKLPHLINDKINFISTYYNNIVNKHKLDNLLSFLDVEFKIKLKVNEIKNIGKWLKVNNFILFDYLFTTFEIRNSLYGKFSDNNELSNITFKVLREKFGNINEITNLVHKFTTGNSNSNNIPLFYI